MSKSKRAGSRAKQTLASMSQEKGNQAIVATATGEPARTNFRDSEFETSRSIARVKASRDVDLPLGPASDRRSNRVPWYLKVFVAIHLIAITVWALPHPPNAVITGKAKPIGTDILLQWNDHYLRSFPPIQAYLFFTGFWQFWDMFAPNPAQIDIYADEEIIYKDGHKERFQYPRMYLLPISQKFLKERYRKFFERANSEDYCYIWPVFAQRIAYLNDKYPGNPPVTVQLWRHWKEVSAPGKPQPTEYKSYNYYNYAVDQAWLSKEREGLP